MVRQNSISQNFFANNMETIEETSNYTSQHIREKLQENDFSFSNDEDAERYLANSGKELDLTGNSRSRRKRKKKFELPGGSKVQKSKKRIKKKYGDFNMGGDKDEKANQEKTEVIEVEVSRSVDSVDKEKIVESKKTEGQNQKYVNSSEEETQGIKMEGRFNESFGIRNQKSVDEMSEKSGIPDKRSEMNMSEIYRAQGDDYYQSQSEFCFETDSEEEEDSDNEISRR